MLVTFTTTAYSDITMFGTAAVTLLKLMGQSGNVPGAIMAEDVPQALDTLRSGLAQTQMLAEEHPQPFDEGDRYADDEDREPPVGLEKRAAPLISLLEAAVAAGENVQWNS